MRRLLCSAVGSIVWIAAARAQLADVRFRGDLSFGLIQSDGLRARAYTPLGRFSTLGIQAMLPVGIKANIFQRVSNLPNDVDNDGFDEYSVEDPGSWKLGKQYLPFGGGTLMRETALAVRVDSALIFEGLPLAIAIVDQGRGRQYGLSARLGSKGLGASVAIGRHFGINGTSLAVINRPSIGEENGWQRMFGADWNRRFGRFHAKIEGVILRGAEGISDDEEFVDVYVGYDIGQGRRHSIGFGATREIGNDVTNFRLMGTYTAQKGVQLEGMLRQTSNSFVDFSVFLRIKF
jgi:hypothetical protein